jgi:hypothetical protein
MFADDGRARRGASDRAEADDMGASTTSASAATDSEADAGCGAGPLRCCVALFCCRALRLAAFDARRAMDPSMVS